VQHADYQQGTSQDPLAGKTVKFLIKGRAKKMWRSFCFTFVKKKSIYCDNSKNVLYLI
jgi:hypothetical protein